MSRFGNLEFESNEQPRHGAESESRDGAYWMASAETAYQAMDFELALRHYSRVLEFEPGSIPAWTGQVRVLIELGEYREARVWADKALERFPTAPELLAAKAVALGRLGDLDPALAFSDASLEERGDTAYIWLARGDVLLARKERRADYCFEKACALEPNGWWIHWLAARIRHHYGQFAAALKLAQHAAAAEPGNWVVWLLCGDCETALGFAGNARRSYQQVADLNPEFREIRERVHQLDRRGILARLTGWFRQGLRS